MEIRMDALGEDAVVDRLISDLPLQPDVVAGAGDDCAVIAQSPSRWLLLKTDACVEGVHFLRKQDPARVGWKALCRAISDIAAMAGTPEQALITVAIPRELPVAWLDGLYTGLKRAARSHSVSIVGGETSRSPGPIFISVAITGSVAPERCIFRSGGVSGDDVYVTGRLGGSIHGKHLDFIPRLKEAQWLAASFPIHAMMDLSDGVAADLPRLARRSQCGWSIDDTAIPCSDGVTVEQALTDGEDYELLFTTASNIRAELEHAWQNQFPDLNLARIGSLQPLDSNAGTALHGYDHFAKR